MTLWHKSKVILIIGFTLIVSGVLNIHTLEIQATISFGLRQEKGSNSIGEHNFN